MLIWGWRNGKKTWPLDTGGTLLCVYRYFHIYYIIRFTYKRRWYIQANPSADFVEMKRADLMQELDSGLPRVNAYF